MVRRRAGGRADGDREPEGHGRDRVGQRERCRPCADGRLRRASPGCARRQHRADRGHPPAGHDGARQLHRHRGEEADAHRPHGHRVPGGDAGEPALSAGRQQALRSGNRRRQGRHRRHPPRAGDPQGRRLARLRATHGPLQPRRGGRLDRLRRDDRAVGRAARRGVLVRADEREVGRQDRGSAARRGGDGDRDDGGRRTLLARRRCARPRSQRADRAGVPAAANARPGQRHPRSTAELDHCASGRRPQPDPGEGDRQRRRSPHHAPALATSSRQPCRRR